MTTEQLAPWEADFEAFHARFAPFFQRREPREHAQQYVRGLLSPVERKNTWQMAEALGEVRASLQRTLEAHKGGLPRSDSPVWLATSTGG